MRIIYLILLSFVAFGSFWGYQTHTTFYGAFHNSLNRLMTNPSSIHPSTDLELREGGIDSRIEYDSIFTGISDTRFIYLKGDERAPLLVYFHGNDETIEEAYSATKSFNEKGYLERAYNVLIVEYPHYGNESLGIPSVADINNSTLAAIEKFRSNNQHIVFVGRGIGAGNAMNLANMVKPNIIVLLNGFYQLDGFPHAFGKLNLTGLNNKEKIGKLSYTPKFLIINDQSEKLRVDGGILAKTSREESTNHSKSLVKDLKSKDLKVDERDTFSEQSIRSLIYYH